MKQLSSDYIKKLHKKYSPSEKAYELVYTHCKIISEIASLIIKNYNQPVDIDTITKGALLHDIGAYRLIDSEDRFDEKNYLKHGILGCEILRNENIPEPICLIAERHTGVGINKKEIILNKLPLPPRDYLAISIEEQIVMYADKFHSKTPRFNSFNSYKKNIAKFGDLKVKKFVKFSTVFGIPNLERLAIKYNTPII